ncbi:DUF1579 domain-containing protein [Pseudoalteromonas phenolica]|uniref:DUF1579 domain-containing protein n=1 Tax=Pseudoalteromonas phenolica TaxID=161398 RepID=A0A4V2EJU4_9GAMM|nr:DUF1579 domain-containing protein [Pseudoalteromonas phenolica]RZQ53558.1 DUF1579 domain-containing protein [Pseudoalteromonas phenolica]
MTEQQASKNGSVAQASVAGAQDFDFVIGNWRVHHKRLDNMFSKDKYWVEFERLSSTSHILDGAGNVEDNLLYFPDGAFRAVVMRAFNAQTGRWSIWWLDGRFPDKVDKPVVGSFKNNIGLFYADEVIKGRKTKVRFQWDASTPNNPKWAKAFSFDEEKSWETNWTMSFIPQ